MLNSSCPQCDVPLMRSRDGTTSCAVCNIGVVTEDEFDPTRHHIVDESAGAAGVGAPAPNGSFSEGAASGSRATAAASSAGAGVGSSNDEPSDADVVAAREQRRQQSELASQKLSEKLLMVCRLLNWPCVVLHSLVT